jgi:hypothetical protein
MDKFDPQNFRFLDKFDPIAKLSPAVPTGTLELLANVT